MIVDVAAGGPAGTNGYLLADPAAGEAVLIDAPYEATGELLASAKRRGLRISRLLLTHGHWDHIAEHARVTAETGATVGIHAADEFFLRDGQPRGMSWFEPIAKRRPDFLLDPAQPLQLGRLTIRVFLTPGHSPGGVCLLVSNPELSVADGSADLLFVGDTLFASGIGRMDLPGGDPEAMAASLRDLMKFPDALPVLPGHGPDTTIGDERRHNPYVRDALTAR